MPAGMYGKWLDQEYRNNYDRVLSLIEHAVKFPDHQPWWYWNDMQHTLRKMSCRK